MNENDSQGVNPLLRAMITGATGFVGSNLARHLLRDGWDVHVIVRKDSNLKLIKDIYQELTIHEHDGSTQNLIDILSKGKPSVVFHLASLFLSDHQSQDVENLILSNVLFSTQLAEAMVVNGVKYLINTGTSWQHYDNNDYCPVNLYAATKQAFEDILTYYTEAKDICVITLALFDTYGPNDPRNKLIKLLTDSANTQKPILMSPGHQYVDLVYIKDVVEAYSIAANLVSKQSRGHKIYGVSSGKPVQLKELVKLFEDITGIKVPVEWGKRPYRPREVMTPWSCSIPLPGWVPGVPLEEGIRSLSNRGNKC